MYIDMYFDKVKEILGKIAETQKDNMVCAARKIVETTINKKMIYIFGATHAGILAQEAFYRTGGLVNINPILPDNLTCNVRPITLTSMYERKEGLGSLIVEQYNITKGDLLIIHSVSGRNAVSVNMAQSAKEKGAFVIAITSLEYSRNSSSRANNGLRLFECADLVIDNCGVFGDAALVVEGFKGKVSPTSTVAGSTIINAICAEACGIFIEKGVSPPIFMSANIDGGDEYNLKLMDEYKDRIIYM